MNELTLYPSNWLYNAGVIGFLHVLDRAGKKIKDWIQRDGTIKGDVSDLLSEEQIEGTDFKIPLLTKSWLLESWERLTDKKGTNEAEKIKEVWGKLFNVHYRGFFNANTNFLFRKSGKSEPLIIQLGTFIQSLSANGDSRRRCSFCLMQSSFAYKNVFTSEHSKMLGASAGDKGVPNSFWNLNPEQSLHICDLCSFILLCQHLALTPLSDGSEIFINAPSFKMMYHLNKFAREVFGASSAEEAHGKREILAMSIIEYGTKIQTTLGVWTGMNIEVVSKRGGKIAFFSLPYEVVQLLADRQIASLLSQIGEFAILNLVLDQDFSRLMELGYRLLRIGLKPYGKRGKSEKEFVNENLKLEKNRRNPQYAAEQIFQLCALIEDKRKRRYMYEYASLV
jgi:CRISPR-associated protein Cst1